MGKRTVEVITSGGEVPVELDCELNGLAVTRCAYAVAQRGWVITHLRTGMKLPAVSDSGLDCDCMPLRVARAVLLRVAGLADWNAVEQGNPELGKKYVEAFWQAVKDVCPADTVF